MKDPCRQAGARWGKPHCVREGTTVGFAGPRCQDVEAWGEEHAMEGDR